MSHPVPAVGPRHRLLVLPPARGGGVVVEASRRVSRWALDELGLHRLRLCYSVANPASCRVAAKAGWREPAHHPGRRSTAAPGPEWDRGRPSRQVSRALHQMLRTWPGMMTSGLAPMVCALAPNSLATVVPCEAAIALSVSPLLTV